MQEQQTYTDQNMPLPDENLYALLEKKYGGGFAQWFVDELQKKRA